MFRDRTQRHVLLVCALACTAACADADAAHRKILHGTTGQGSSLTLVVGQTGRVSRLSFGWEATCRRNGRFRDGTNVRPTGRRSTARAFRVTGGYTGIQRGGYSFRIRIVVRGTRGSSAGTWRGTIRGSVRIRRHGREVDRCVLRRTAWRATPPQAKRPAPAPPQPGPVPAPDPAAAPQRQEPAYAPTPPPQPGPWRLVLHGDAADPLAGPLPYDSTFASPGDELTITATREHVAFTARSRDGETWNVSVGAPKGERLEAGEYPGATRTGDDGHPQLGVSGHGHGCATSTGSFTVARVEFDAYDRLLRLSVQFEHHCEGGLPALRGTFDYDTH